MTIFMGQVIQKAFFLDHLTLEDKGTKILSNAGNNDPKTQHHIQEDLNPQQQHCEHFKPCMVNQFTYSNSFHRSVS